METIRKVRQAHFRDGKGIREISRDLNLSRNTVRNIIRSGITDQKYERTAQPHPKIGTFIERLSELLQEDSDKPIRHRRERSALVLSNCSEKDTKVATMPSVVMWVSGKERSVRLQSKPTSLLNMPPVTLSNLTGVMSR